MHLKELCRPLFDLKEALLDFVYPPFCLLCKKHLLQEQRFVCGECWNSLKVIPEVFCPTCKSFIPPGESKCVFCSNPKKISWIKSLGTFDDYYKELIHQFKYRGKTSLGRMFGEKLGEEAKKEQRFEEFDYIIPVPLHPARKRERG